MSRRPDWVVLFAVACLLTAFGAACGHKSSNPNAPGDNGMSRPVSPPTPGGVIAAVPRGSSALPARTRVSRVQAVVAFLGGPLGRVTTYGFFVLVTGGAVFGFIQVLGRDPEEPNGHP